MDGHLEMQTPENIAVGLTRNEALVLFEFLRRCDDDDRYSFVDQAEQRVLWNVECLLEKQLAEIFSPAFGKIVEAARDAVRDPD